MSKWRSAPTRAEVSGSRAPLSYEGYTLTFTDGSKTEGEVSCAFFSSRDTRSFSLPEYTTVFSSELVAINKALCFIEVSDEALHLILSDSLSSLLALQVFSHGNPFIKDILRCLTSLESDGKCDNVGHCFRATVPAATGQGQAAATRGDRPCPEAGPVT